MSIGGGGPITLATPVDSLATRVVKLPVIYVGGKLPVTYR